MSFRGVIIAGSGDPVQFVADISNTTKNIYREMARNEIAMLVDLYQNRNTASKTYGKFYGRVFNRETLSLKGFAKHMMEHGKRITYGLNARFGPFCLWYLLSIIQVS